MARRFFSKLTKLGEFPGLGTEIYQNWPPSPSTDNAPAVINSLLGQGYQRLPRIVPHGLLGVGATDNHKTQMGVGQDILNEALYPQVFSVQRPHQGGFRPGLPHYCGRQVL